MTIEKAKVLITVKTYPTLSAKYGELVCTAGFREDGSWIRLYPIPFRIYHEDTRFKKYQWIELDIVKVKKNKDFRPESYRPYAPYEEERILALDTIDTDGGTWERRREICLKHVWTDLSALIEQAKGPKKTSLAVFKPKEVLDFICEPVEERDWPPEKLEEMRRQVEQGGMFDAEEEREARSLLKVAEKIPYKFSYRFCDEKGRESTLMIEDWETCQLYRNCRDKEYEKCRDMKHSEEVACQKVKKKYFDDFAKTKDLHFFLGTTFQYHLRNAPNPFIIIGTFHPQPPSPQMKLF